MIDDLRDVNSGAAMLFGATMDSLRAASILKNLRTLHIRIKQHSTNASYLAQKFESIGLKTVYPGLPSHPSHQMFKMQMNTECGFGGLLTIDVGTLDKANALMELMQHNNLGYLAVSLGFYKTLFSAPGTSTSSEIPKEEQKTMGLNEGLIRFSVGIDNDGDGLVDEDPWGDSNGDGILDDDGDCLSLAAEHQDSNGDGNPCGPGDLGVDEDFSEQQLTDLVNTREIYLVPMLNVDGNRYDREEFCGENAWETCPTGGWRKNLRNNGPQPLPDFNEEVDEDCDGVDLNRNFQFEWGWPLGATIPLVPGTCTPAEDERAGISNNDVYTGPYDTTDNDGDGLVNEDNVDGEDDDNDGRLDEDWAGGNSEPETLFVQDLTEMNDDDNNLASDFKMTLSWHSFSELVLYPWGHCTGCETPDHQQLIYHGDQMAEMTDYTNMQSSDLYPTTVDYCDWQYGVHDAYCYTMEIGTAFHQRPEDVNHIAVRNVGVPFYVLEIADNPRERANLAMENISQQNYLITPIDIDVPESGDIPIDVCVSNDFPYSEANSFVKYRMVKPSRLQSDYGPREWATTPWESVQIERVDEACTTASGNGTVLRAEIPVSESSTGKLHYKAQITTLSGSDSIYPADGSYYELGIEYRSSYGNFASSLFLFVFIAGTVWGGLGACLRLMLGDEPELTDAEVA